MRANALASASCGCAEPRISPPERPFGVRTRLGAVPNSATAKPMPRVVVVVVVVVAVAVAVVVHRGA